MKINIDLLPNQRKLELKRNKLFRKILGEEILFLFPILVFVIILCNIYYLLYSQRSSSMQTQTMAQSQESFKELSRYEEKFKEVNEGSAAILKLKSGHFRWSRVFEKMSGIVPDGVSISNFSTKNYKLFLIGKAQNRDMLLSLKKNIESEDCFAEVNVPLSDLVTRDNVEFQIDFSVKPDCLKK